VAISPTLNITGLRVSNALFLLKQASDPAGFQNLQAGVPASFQNFTRWFRLNNTSANVSVQQICTCSQCIFLIYRKPATCRKLASLKCLFNCHMIAKVWKIITIEKHIEIQECLCSATLYLKPGYFCDLYKNRHLGYSKFYPVFLEVEDFFHHRCRIRIYTLIL